MSEILPFVSCLEPVQVKTSKGLQLVPCGHCVACENKRRSELRAMVANEELKAKHSFFITLTFDDEHLPLFYWKDQCDFCPDDYLVRDDASVRDALFQGNMSSISKALSELDSYQIVRDCALFSNQSRIYTDKYFTKNRVRDFDTGELGIPFKNYGDVSRELRDYHIQLHKNLLRCKKLGFKTTGYTWLSYADSHGLDSSFCVPLLYYRDIQNFMKRLNKYIYGKIGKYKTFRYFIIGEYGTKSFRPHWHIILFTDSDEVATLMYDGYRKVIPLSRKRDLYTNSLLSSCWKFGYSTFDKTDGKASGYLSNYVVGSHSLPRILKRFAPQKTFHSSFFGSPYSQSESIQRLRSRDFDGFSTYRYVDEADGNVIKSRPLWRSYYSQFFPQFVGINDLPRAEVYRVLKIYPKFASFFHTDCITDIANYIGNIIARSHTAITLNDVELQIVRFFDWFKLSDATSLSVSPIRDILYASKKFLRICSENGFTTSEYFSIMCDFMDYQQQKTLHEHYLSVQTNEVYAVDYYSIYSDKIDLDYLSSCQLFKVFGIASQRINSRLVKHKAIVEQIKNI